MASAQGESYSREELSRILGLSQRQLTAWQKQGLVSNTGPYSFSDLIALKTIQKLRSSNIPLKKIQRSVMALKRKLNEVQHPLTELKISSDGNRVIVNYRGGAMEPDTGQLLFNFETRQLHASIHALKRPSADLPRRRQEAEEWFLQGLELEQRPETLPEAMRAYCRAIEMNPKAAGACINLGTLYYNEHRLAEAEKCYRAAIDIDPGYALAYFNLGNVHDERRNLEEALQCYERALRLSPGYGDAHYNLALVYEKLEMRGKAVHHWRAYLNLDPSSPWAAYARQQLSRTPLKLIPTDEPPAPTRPKPPA